LEYATWKGWRGDFVKEVAIVQSKVFGKSFKLDLKLINLEKKVNLPG